MTRVKKARKMVSWGSLKEFLNSLKCLTGSHGEVIETEHTIKLYGHDEPGIRKECKRCGLVWTERND